jgi:hypothetical protein
MRVTQMVTLAVYFYALGAVIGGQFLDNDHTTGGLYYNYYVPATLLLQGGFYFGWLRVAETLINPLGEGDSYFDINQILERNLTVGDMRETNIAKYQHPIHTPAGVQARL